jgi:transcriptional repressor NrdR
MAMEKLRALDHIAYIRFASVYQSFEDLADLKREVDQLFAEDSPRNGKRAAAR